MHTNDPNSSHPKNCIDFLCHSADIYGEKIAVTFNDFSLTYKELVSQASCLAAHLRASCVKEGDLVGLCMSRSHQMIVGIYAILFAGAAYVPLDPVYPKSRIQDMSRDANLNVILSNLDNTKEIFGHDTRVIRISNNPNDFAEDSARYVKKPVSPDALAYVMYTSGSTGRPKGVMITHRNLNEFIRIVPKILDISRDDVYLQSASITYALSVRQIFLALSYGARLVVASDSQIKDSVGFFTLIKEKGVTLIDFVPSHWRASIRALESMDLETRTRMLDCKLRRIVTVGEELHWDIPQRWRQIAGLPAHLVNLFGQTETTGLVCAYPLPEKIENRIGIVPVGKPIPETRALIVTPNTLEEVLPGEIGELCIENPCVGKGYLRQPELSAQKFYRIELAGKSPNSFLYRTGDLARLSPEGNIKMLGRSDHQIKIRGMRVELGEIESILLSHSAIYEAAVMPAMKNSKDICLKAFVSIKSGFSANEKELLNYVKGVLPAHMVPVSIIVCGSLPHTPNGKIDRKQLKSATPIESDREPTRDQLSSDTQRQLAEMWKKILGIKSVRQTDNFFDLGGGSFEAMVLAVKIEKTFGKRIPVSVLYEAPTIEKLAAMLLAKRTKPWPSVVPIRSSGSKEPLFMVHGAQGNILLYNDLARYLDPHRPLYGIQAQGLDGRTAPYKTIEERADSYIQELLNVQPQGPYYLLGYCMGGTIALEMGQKLKAAGQEVAFLGMIETYNWSSLPMRSKLDWMTYYIEKVSFHCKNISLLKGKERKKFIWRKLREAKSRTQIWKGKISNLLGLKSKNVNVHLTNLCDNNDRAAFSYIPLFYDGTVHHFTPIERYKIHRVPEADWWNISSNVVVHKMEAYPAAILMEPFASKLALCLNKIFKDSTPSSPFVKLRTINPKIPLQINVNY